MVSPTRNELLTNVIDYISLVTGLDKSVIIRGKQNAPVPIGGNYATVIYSTDTQDGTAAISYTPINQDIMYAIKGKRFVTFEIQFYREGATDLGKALLMGASTPAAEIFFYSSLFTFRQIRSVSESATVISENYEERAILLLDLTIAERQNIMVNRIEKANILVTQNNSESSSITRSLNVDVS